jgi:hypothetical protein
MPLELSSIKMRVGANLKYLKAFSGMYIPETSATMETASEGRYISLQNLNYQVDVATLDDENLFTGKGFAMDLSASMSFGSITASVAVLDIGSLSFDKNTHSYGGGVELDSLFLSDLNSNVDSGKIFTMGMPTRLVVHLEKNVLNGDYIKHGMYLTYIQGFNNIAGATTKPYIAAGYSYSLKNIINVGPTVNYGGYAGFGLGMFLSTKIGPLRMGAGTNAGLSYLLMPGSTKSVDFSFMTSWAIGGGEAKKKAKMEAVADDK